LNQHQLKVKMVFMAGLLLVCLLGTNCTTARDFDSQLRSIVKPYKFNSIQWEFDAVFGGEKPETSDRHNDASEEANKVTGYFATVTQIKNLESVIEEISTGSKPGNLTSLKAELDRLQKQNMALTDTVEEILERQIREALSQQGIFNPIDKYLRAEVVFPPVNFKFEKPPYLLVVSPRVRIESMREVVLQQNISVTDMESIEAEVDKLGVSALVMGLGGFAGTYPSFVTNDADLRFVIDAVAEEWLHQYLVFKPLGFRYLLDIIGISRNYDIATMNETVAGMIGEEIGGIVYGEYYAPPANDNTQSQADKSGFDFNREMREVRRAVDEYLVRGEIEQAEEFMEQKRQYLAINGYYIRKLNQAYFAFHGTYADDPTSISPIGVELKELRSQSDSLKEFLEIVSAMTSRQDLTYRFEKD